MKASVKAFLAVALWVTASVSVQADKWVGTWGTAPQLVEQNNLPPQPRLSGNSLRQIVQVSIGGTTLRLKLSNEYSSGSTEVQSVEIAHALSSGSSSAIDESTTTIVTFDGTSSPLTASLMVPSPPNTQMSAGSSLWQILRTNRVASPAFCVRSTFKNSFAFSVNSFPTARMSGLRSRQVISVKSKKHAAAQTELPVPAPTSIIVLGEKAGKEAA